MVVFIPSILCFNQPLIKVKKHLSQLMGHKFAARSVKPNKSLRGMKLFEHLSRILDSSRLDLLETLARMLLRFGE